MALDERGEDDSGTLVDMVAQQVATRRAAAAEERSAAQGGLPNGGGAAAVPSTESSPDGSPKDPKDLDSDASSKPLESSVSMASSEHGSEASSGQSSPHYDAAKDVILRLEFLKAHEFKTIIRAVWVAVLAGTVMLIVAVYVKIDKPDNQYLTTDTVSITNLAFAGILCPALLFCWVSFVYRVYRSNLSQKRWSHRRRRACTLAGIEITLQLINCVFFILPNAWVLARKCSWFDPVVAWAGFVRWTCWNTLFLSFIVQAHGANPSIKSRFRRWVAREDGAIMDAPLWTHWPKLILWFALEGILLALTLVIQTGSQPYDPAVPNCRDQDFDCHFTAAGTTLISLNMACIIVYFLFWLFFITRAMNNLKHLPYNSMRMANLTVRLQIRQRGLSVGFFVLCLIFYSFVRLNTCSSYILSWLGYLPMQVVMTATAIVNAYICMPKRPHQGGILQVWLQEFAWLERDIKPKKEERTSSLPPDSYEGFCLDCEPLWCFETTVKMMYWSFLVYDYEEAKAGPPSPYTPDTALLLYELEHWECMWERSLDTKAIMGWSSDTVVIAFRGTASMANVKADLQVWRTRWPPGIGRPLLGT